MKIALAQLALRKGEVEFNVQQHRNAIKVAHLKGAEAIFFSELSLTSYEPELAKELEIAENDERVQQLATDSRELQLMIGVGVPSPTALNPTISMLIFKPDGQLLNYAKRYVHEDELPFFSEGQKQLWIEFKDEVIVPAICYESLLDQHAEESLGKGGTVYLASVAKPQAGVDKALKHYPRVAMKYQVPVLMVNAVGPSDNFVCVGQTAVWNRRGKLVQMLDRDQQQLLLFDTSSERTEVLALS